MTKSYIVKEVVSVIKLVRIGSAYVMSYLAFKQTIRENILNAKEKPDTISNDDWNNKVICVLKNDDHWEDCINNMINTTYDNTKNCLGKVFKFSNRERVYMTRGNRQDIVVHIGKLKI